MSWRPAASLEVLRLRAHLLGRIRSFFAERDVLEVETPLLSVAATPDPQLHSFCAYSSAPADDRAPRFLHTSPEFPMKRLLAAGSGSIYQICKAFRGAERGRLHNPEFTLIEWYRVGLDYHALMDEVAALAAATLDGLRVLAPPERFGYHDAFAAYAGVDPHRATGRELAATARARGLAVSGLALEDADAWRDLVLTHLVEPRLGRGRLSFLYDYPASQAALARIRPGEPPVAERFEAYLDGMELANGFAELADAGEQRERFRRANAVRRAQGLPQVPLDERLLAALAHGLPACSGVALGFDRLVMAAAGAARLADVLAFPDDRA